MANNLAIIAAVVLAIAGFFAFKTNEALDVRTSEVEAEQNKQAALKTQITTLNDETKGLETSTTDTTAKAETAEAEVQTASQALATAEATLQETQAKVSQQQEAVQSAQAKLDEAGDIKNLAPKVTGLSQSIAELEDQIATAEARFSTLRAQVTAGNERFTELETRKNEQSSGKTAEDLKASLISVYDGQGFVIISGGDSAGIAANSTLNVMRGGEKIAELRVTSVEPNRAAADIVPDSLAEGTFLRRGDLVVAGAAAATPGA